MQEILIEKQEDKKVIALLSNGKLEEVYEEKDTTRRLEGNIYLGIVKDILPGMQAAFVDIGKEKNTFIHIKDILPKVSKITGNKNEDLEKYNIKKYIQRDKPILVQVKKDSTSLKGAKISTDIHIPGRFVVVMPKDKFITISKKIEDEKERERLLKIVKEAVEDNVGIIVRTAAQGKSKEELSLDIKNTIQKWNQIQEKSKQAIKSRKPQE